MEGHVLALAMHVVAAASVGVRAARNFERLLAMQEEDGTCPLGWMHKYGASGVRIGHSGRWHWLSRRFTSTTYDDGEVPLLFDYLLCLYMVLTLLVSNSEFPGYGCCDEQLAVKTSFRQLGG